MALTSDCVDGSKDAGDGHSSMNGVGERAMPTTRKVLRSLPWGMAAYLREKGRWIGCSCVGTYSRESMRSAEDDNRIHWFVRHSHFWNGKDGFERMNRCVLTGLSALETLWQMGCVEFSRQ